MRFVFSGRGETSFGGRWLGQMQALIAGLAFVWGSSASSGPIIPGSSSPAQPTSAADLGSAKSIPDIELAIKSFEKRDFKACIETLRKAVKAHPELPPPHALFAKLALLSNQGALVHPALERAAMEDPNHPEVYILFANVALIEGRLTDAAVHLEKAKALASAGRWTAEQGRRLERLCYQGNASVAEARGDWKAAKTALSAWLELEPGNARARERLGKALFGLGQAERAYEELQRAGKADATLGPAPLTMGWLYTRDRNVKKAREWMERSLKLLPDSLRVRMGVTSWLLEQGKADEAQTQAEAAAKLDPKSNEVKRLLGLAARERKDFARSEEIFQALALESPVDSWLRNQLALALVEQSDPAKQRRAVELAELSVRQNGKDPAAVATLGMVYYRLKRLDDAEKLLQAVFNSGKANSDATYVLGLIKSARGQQDPAMSLIKMALAAPGLFLFRNDAQQWLDHHPVARSK